MSQLLRHGLNLAVFSAISGLATASLLAAPARAFNFAASDVGGSCEPILGGEILPDCQTADGFRLVPTGGWLHSYRTGVGVTTPDGNPLMAPQPKAFVPPLKVSTGIPAHPPAIVWPTTDAGKPDEALPPTSLYRFNPHFSLVGAEFGEPATTAGQSVPEPSVLFAIAALSVGAVTLRKRQGQIN